MLKLTKTGIGLLTRQYRSVLRKCWEINVGLWNWAMNTATGAASAVGGAMNALWGSSKNSAKEFSELIAALLKCNFLNDAMILKNIANIFAISAKMPAKLLSLRGTPIISLQKIIEVLDRLLQNGVSLKNISGGRCYNSKKKLISTTALATSLAFALNLSATTNAGAETAVWVLSDGSLTTQGQPTGSPLFLLSSADVTTLNISIGKRVIGEGIRNSGTLADALDDDFMHLYAITQGIGMGQNVSGYYLSATSSQGKSGPWGVPRYESSIGEQLTALDEAIYANAQSISTLQNTNNYIKITPVSSYNDPAVISNNFSGSVAIGSASRVSADYSVALGAGALAYQEGTTALGIGAKADGFGSVALGAGSQALEDYVVSVGSGNSGDSHQYRRIVNVANGVDDNDAVNYGQIKNFVTASTNALTNYYTKLDSEEVQNKTRHC